MKIKVKIKLEDKLVEVVKEFDESKLTKRGYSVQNTLYSFATDVSDKIVDVDYEVLDGEYKGLDSNTHIYHEWKA